MTTEMQELASVADKLNQESNEINTTIGALNAKLAALNLGLEEWLEPDEDHWQLGYGKVQDQWQLAVRYCAEIRIQISLYGGREYLEPVPGTELTVTPLLQATRELRIRALRYWPDLKSYLKDAAEARLKTIRDAKQKATQT
jgi:hypothetical protein